MSRPDRKIDLVAFDVDGTLILHEKNWTVWEVLNDRFTGTAEVNQQRYAEYKAGRLSYADWVALDVEGWRKAGATKADIVAAFEPLTLVKGCHETMTTLKQHGQRLVVISGTLDLLLNTLYPDHPFDEVYTNHIGFEEDGRIAHWRATPFDMDGKATALKAIAMREGIPLDRCAFVGDSSNDVWVAKVAGFTVAFNPKSEEFRRQASVVVESESLEAIVPHLVTDGPPPPR